MANDNQSEVVIVEAVRKLTPEERDIYSGSIVKAASLVPSYRDALALMRPFFDATAGTAYIDRHSRVGLSPWFFQLDVYKRASVVLHECSHVLHNCFVRGETMGADPYLNNIASDLEINCGLVKAPRVDLSFAIHPEKDPYNFPNHMSQEQYFHLLKEGGFDKPDPNCPQHGDGSGDKGDQGGQGPSEKGDKGDQGDQGSGGEGDQGEDGQGDGDGEGQGEGEGQGQGSGSGQGQGQGQGKGDPKGKHSHDPNASKPCTCPHPQQGQGQPGQGQGQPGDNQTSQGCDEPTEERNLAADDAGVERASEAEQSIAKKNTAIRVAEDAKKARQRGDGHLADFLETSLSHMRPPKVNWRTIFRRLVSQIDEAVVRGRSDFTYRRPSRRLSDSKFIFPGMVKYEPSAMVGVDTSGSMSHEDHLRTAYEIEGILKAASSIKNNLKVFSVDTKVSNVKPVSSVSKLDLRGGGGTDMSVGWKYVNSLPKKEVPDIFILATDGYTAWPPVEEELRIAKKKKYTSVLLVTTKGGYDSVSEGVKKLCKVVDISEE